MLTSRHFKIRRARRDDWFNAILNTDTPLFLDPFLIFKDTAPQWRRAHDAIVAHFNRAFLLIADGNRNPRSLPYQKALHVLTFTEPKEFCLGYTAQGTAGSGTGKGHARDIAEAISDAIRRGLKHPRHFEELGILNEGIGRDRISDITCTILKPILIRYTQEIARERGMPVESHVVHAGAFDEQRQRWQDPVVRVPTNPFTNGPLLLVPERFLRDLPTLNPEAWWENYEDEMLREDVNYEIMGRVDKATIIAAAREHPDAVRRWTIAKEGEQAEPYDFSRDAKGVWAWDAATEVFTRRNPLRLPVPRSDDEFLGVIEMIVQKFALFVEDQGGWQLLWDRNGQEKPESAAQLLFRGIAAHYCQANDISLDPEVNLGRGPVDFKFSTGYQQRAHLEVKKLHNGKFWNGLTTQLPTYMRSDEVRDGWFLVLRYRSGRAQDERVREVGKRIAAVSSARQIALRHKVVDVRPQESASRI